MISPCDIIKNLPRLISIQRVCHREFTILISVIFCIPFLLVGPTTHLSTFCICIKWKIIFWLSGITKDLKQCTGCNHYMRAKLKYWVPNNMVVGISFWMITPVRFIRLLPGIGRRLKTYFYELNWNKNKRTG